MISESGKASTLSRFGAKLRGLLSLSWRQTEFHRWGPRPDDGAPALGPNALEELMLLRQVVDALPQHIFAKDGQGRYIMANRAKAMHHGLTTEELLGLRNSDLSDGTVPGDVGFQHAERTVLRSGVAQLIERYEGISKDGTSSVRTMRKLPLHDRKGRVAGVVSISDDISPLDAAERQARESERRFRLIAETTPYAMFVAREADGRILYANRATSELFAFSDDPTLHSTPELYYDPAERTVLLQKLNADGAYANYELRHKRINGEAFWGLVCSSRIEFDGEQAILTSLVDITERKQAQEQSQADRLLLQQVIDTVPNSIVVKSRDGSYRLVNRAHAAIFGLEPEQLVRKQLETLNPLPSGLALQMSDQDRQVWETGQAVLRDAVEVVDHLGRSSIQRITKLPLRDAAGDITGLVGVSVDVTELKRAESEAKESHRVLQTVFDHLPLTVYVKDHEGHYVTVNRQFAELFSMSEQDCVGINWPEISARAGVTHDDSLGSDMLVLSQGERWEIPANRLQFTDGREFYRHLIKAPNRNSNGEITGLVGIGLDVTELKQAETQARASQQVLQAVFDHLPASIFVKSIDGHYVTVNGQFAELFGVEVEDCIGLTWPELMAKAGVIHDESQGSDDPVLGEGRRTEIATNPLRFADGREYYRQLVKGPLRDADGNITGLVGIGLDVSELKRAEAEASANQRLLRGVFDHIPTDIFVKDHEGRYVTVNRHFCELYGIAEGDCIGLTSSELADWTGVDLNESFESDNLVLVEGQRVDVPASMLSFKDGRTFVRHVVKAPLFDSDGAIAGLVGTALDVTQQVRQAEALKESESLLQRAQEIGGIGTWRRNLANGEITWSPQMCRMWGMDTDDGPITFEAMLERIHPEDRERFHASRDAVVRSGGKIAIRHRIVLPAGELRHIHTVGEVVPATGSQQRVLVGICQDVTESVGAQQELQQQEWTLSRAQEIGGIGTWRRDLGTNHLYWSPESYRIWGLPEDDPITVDQMRQFVHPDDVAEFDALRRQTIDGGGRFDLQHRVVRPDGTIRHVRTVGELLTPGENQAATLVGITHDITERVQTEEDLRRSEEQSRTVLENALQGINVRVDGRVVFLNQAQAEALGYDSPEDYLANQGAPFATHFAPEDQANLVDLNRKLQKGEIDSIDGEFDVIRLDGSVRKMLHRRRRFEWEGKPATIASSIDITERVRAEQLLRRSEEQYRNVFENALQGVNVRVDGKVVFANKILADTMGYESVEAYLANQDAEQYALHYAPDVRAEQLDLYRMLLNGEIDSIDRETELIRIDGSVRHVLLRRRRFEWEGKPAILSTSIDITERVQAEEQLRRSEQRFRAIGEGLPFGLSIIAEDTGTLLFANETMREQFGITDALENHNVAEFYADPNDRLPVLEEYRRHGRYGPREVRFRNADGNDFWALASGAIIDYGGRRAYLSTWTDLTERKEAEARLQESRGLLRQLIDAVPQHISVKETDGQFRLVNRAFAEYHGFQPAELVGRYPSNLPGLDAATARALEAMDQATFEADAHQMFPDLEISGADQIRRRFQVTKVPLHDEDGQISGIVAVAQDITERSIAEQNIRESEARFRNLFEGSIQGILIHRNREMLYANAAYARLFGYDSPEEVLAIGNLDTLVAEGERERLRTMAEDRMGGRGAPDIFETEGLRKNGSIVHLMVAARKVEWNNETVIQSTLVDITERKQAEEQLRTHQRLLEQVVDALPMCIFVKNTNYEYLLVNSAMEQFFGIAKSEIQMLNTSAIPVPDGTRLKSLEDDRWVFENLAPLDQPEAWLESADGVARPYHSLKLPLFDDDGSLIGLLGINRDLTEDRRAEAERTRNVHLLNSVIESAPLILWSVDSDGVVTLSKGKGLAAQGLSSAEVEGRNVFELYSDYPEFTESIRRGLAGESSVSIHETRGAFYERWLQPMLDEEGQQTGIIGVSLDVTERQRSQQELERYRARLEELVEERTQELRETQAELVSKERLAALGLLTGVVSHELRNPLGTIRTSLFSVRESARKGGLEIDRTLSRIDRNITRCDRIIEELLVYTRPTIGEFEPVAIDSLIAEVLEEWIEVPPGVEVHRELASAATLKIDVERVRRCAINLLQNAAQAITEQGSRSNGNIWVATVHVNQRVEIHVRDDGPGIPEENLARLFEPLFSTKGFGVGLGLPIVKQIMEVHGGGVELRSKVDQGTEVVLWLPDR